MPSVCNVSFISIVFSTFVDKSGTTTCSRRVRICTSRRVKCFSQPSMAIPLPDDTAPDMLSFALSGPGLAAAAIFVLSIAAFIFSFAEVGPRKRKQFQNISFILCVNLPSEKSAEVPNGGIRRLREGETMLQLGTFEACTAVARSLEGPGVTYAIYRADPAGLRALTKFPSPQDAAGANWPRGIVPKADENNPQARWEEYQQLGAGGDIEKEWNSFMSKMSPIQRVAPSECKLCGGSGQVRCFRCGGVSRSGGTFSCDCKKGYRECEWCRDRDS